MTLSLSPLITAQRHLPDCLWEMADFPHCVLHSVCGGNCSLCHWLRLVLVAITSSNADSEWDYNMRDLHFVFDAAMGNSATYFLSSAPFSPYPQSLLVLFLLPPEQKKPKRHKIVELLSVVYMLVHFWSGTINHFFK